MTYDILYTKGVREVKDRIGNALICYLLNHCWLWSPTVRLFVKKIPRGELERYISETYKGDE